MARLAMVSSWVGYNTFWSCELELNISMVLGKRCLPSLLPVGQKQHDVRRTPQRTVPFMKDVVLKRQEFISHREKHTTTLLTKPTIPGFLELFPGKNVESLTTSTQL
jgi:hypothetical protein